jgi:GT2 family glycosyltransferase
MNIKASNGPSTDIQFGFIILNYINYAATLNLIDNLVSQPWFKDIKLYVVENGSDNESLAVLKNKDRPFTLLVSDKNLGFARGHNLGIETARNDGCNFIACLNSDLEIPRDPQFTDKLQAIFRNHSPAVIGPDIVTDLSVHQNPQAQFPFSKQKIFKMKLFYLTGFYKLYYLLRVHVLYWPITWFAQVRLRNKIATQQSNQQTDSGYIYAPQGSCIIFTPLFFEHFQGFDPNTFLYTEEYILAEHLRQKGLKAWFENSLKVIHHEHGSTNLLLKSYRDKVKFTLKHSFDSTYYFLKYIMR